MENMEDMGRFERWFRSKVLSNFYKTYEDLLYLWWIIVLIGISSALFLTKFYGLMMLWIIPGAVLFATMIPVAMILLCVWYETKAQ